MHINRVSHIQLLINRQSPAHCGVALGQKMSSKEIKMEEDDNLKHSMQQGNVQQRRWNPIPILIPPYHFLLNIHYGWPGFFLVLFVDYILLGLDVYLV